MTSVDVILIPSLPLRVLTVCYRAPKSIAILCWRPTLLSSKSVR